MDLNLILKLKFPEADFMQDIKLRDDGEGVYIDEWNLQGISSPTEQDLIAWEQEAEALHTQQQIDTMNGVIYDKLNLIDLKSVRALRTNDINRLEQLEQEAIILRGQLL